MPIYLKTFNKRKCSIYMEPNDVMEYLSAGVECPVCQPIADLPHQQQFHIQAFPLRKPIVLNRVLMTHEGVNCSGTFYLGICAD